MCFVQRLEEVLKLTFGHLVKSCHVFGDVVCHDIRYLTVPLGVLRTVLCLCCRRLWPKSESWLLQSASASLSPEFLVMHSSFNCLWCFFKFRYEFAVLSRDVVTIMRQALCSTFCWSTSVVSNPKCSYTTEVLLLFGIKYPSIVSSSGEAVAHTPNFFLGTPLCLGLFWLVSLIFKWGGAWQLLIGLHNCINLW